MYLAHTSLGVSQAALARAFRRDAHSISLAIASVEDGRDVPAFDAQVSDCELSFSAVQSQSDQPEACP